MKLSELLFEQELQGVTGFEDVEIGKITDNTKNLEAGDIFVAITGRSFDGHSACAEMLEKGAAAVVVERDLGLPKQIITDNSRRFFSVLASRYYGEPTKKLKLIAATGTNGKTTTVNIIKHILRSCGKSCGSIGTAGYDVCGKTYEAHLTTPYQTDLYRLFKEMADNGGEYCAMEASSQAISQYRFSGESFICGIFTNLTQDHLDWHGTMENYYQAKKSLFSCCKTAVINIDDSYGRRLYTELSAENKDIRLISVSITKPADLYACKIKLLSGGSDFWICSKAEETAYQAHISMPGGFNVMNSLCAAGACMAAGLSLKEVTAALGTLSGVCGRAEVLYSGKFTVICDYAHTEDGLRKILSSVRSFTKGRLIVVFGAAGERDAVKRPAMGKCVSEYADIAVVTSDNPRFEDPKSIIDMVLEGFEGTGCDVCSFIDRLEAIKYAVGLARENDVIILCGKGHEEYQVIGDDYMEFSEHKIIKELTGLRKEW